MALVEVLAYAGDHLSYQQDAVATEAYLATARRRTSVRRHARLVDYSMHDGCNARAWLHVGVSADTSVSSANFACLTAVDDLADRVVPDSPQLAAALSAGAEWFAPVEADLRPDLPPTPIQLHAGLNELHFYTWGDRQCCLPSGATGATLRGRHDALKPGMVLVLEEAIGPETGNPSDADPLHRHAIRLVEVRTRDGNKALVDPLSDVPITEIRWHPDDALPFPMCVSAESDDGAAIEDVTVALGNIVLVDHGRPVPPESLGHPDAPLVVADTEREHCGGAGEICSEPVQRPGRFAPRLRERPVTMTATVRVPEASASARRWRTLRFDVSAGATAALATDPARAWPSVTLESDLAGEVRRWSAVGDLLGSRGSDLDFVVETESDATASLRFGDSEHGRRPQLGERFVARYRIGNGPSGNVGAEAIRHAVTLDARIQSDPEPPCGGRWRRPGDAPGGPSPRSRGVPHPAPSRHTGGL